MKFLRPILLLALSVIFTGCATTDRNLTGRDEVEIEIRKVYRASYFGKSGGTIPQVSQEILLESRPPGCREAVVVINFRERGQLDPNGPGRSRFQLFECESRILEVMEEVRSKDTVFFMSRSDPSVSGFREKSNATK